MFHLSHRIRASVSCTVFICVSVLALGTFPAQAQQLNKIDPEVRKQAEVDFHGEDMEGKDGPLAAVGLNLALLYREYQKHERAKMAGPFEPKSMSTGDSDSRVISPVRGDYVMIDASAQRSGAELAKDLKGIGAKKIAQSGPGVSALVPIEKIPDLSALSSLGSAWPSRGMVNGRRDNTPRPNAGLSAPKTSVMPGDEISEGDEAMNTDDIRDNLGIDGSGITVGVLSDSYDQSNSASTTPADDISSNDLPPSSRITILSDTRNPNNTNDEGRAMMQLIYDVAPGTDLAFHDVQGGLMGFAEGIEDLANDAGADVIVDDITKFFEPFFQDGPIAQAVDDVAADGIPYFSSAGNYAANSYSSTTWQTATSQGRPDVYDFDPGSSVDTLQNITIPGGVTLDLTLQWDDPWELICGGTFGCDGADTDLDVFLISQDIIQSQNISVGDTLAKSVMKNIDGNPVEYISYNAYVEIEVALKVEKSSGADPGRIKYVIFDAETSIDEYSTNSPTNIGHSNARDGAGVAAASYLDTPEFGTDPADAEGFTSLGGTPILFETNGNRLSSPEVRNQPRFTGPDNTSTTMNRFDPFLGTSAAAPHVAALAALQLEADSGLSPADVYRRLENGAEDMLPDGVPDPTGFDHLTGEGFVDAENTIATDLQITFNEVRTSFFPMITSVVTITDSEGNIVTGLNGENFEMEEEGASETIVDVDEIRESGGNVSSSLVLDRSGSMRGGALADAKEAAKTFVDQLKVGDQASVISFSNGVRIDEPFTSDVGALKAAIDGLSAGGGTALYDGMIQGIEEIELEANSPAVLALTDGQENESSNSKQDVIDLANQAGVPVYTIGLGGSVNTDDLQDIADQTGGRFFQAPNSSDLETIYQEISQQLSSRYEVTHLTSNILLDGTERTIELTASTGGGASDTESTTYTAPDFQIPFVANFGSNPDAGETAQASVDVGSESQPADDLFRATFTVEYDAENLDVVSDGPGSFFGNDVEYRSTINDSTGTIDVGIRNQAGKNTSLKNILAKRASVDNNSQNQGDLVQIEFSADEDAPSGKNYNLSVNNVSAADADGNPIAAEVAPTLLSPATQATSVVSFPTLDWEIDGVDQKYRVQLATDSSFQPVDIDRTTSNTRLSLQSLDKGTAYFWRVRAENAENGPWSDVSSFTTRAAELQADVSRSFGDASGSEDYELVALPGVVDRSLKGTISGEAGLDWQAYWDDGSSENYLQEFDESSTFAFRPGRGFWVTSTETWSFEDRIETVDLRRDTSYAIALHEGWNIVSNPYRDGVEWGRVEAANDDSLQALWRFDGAFTQAETFASAQTGEAFYFLNDRGLDSLTVPYPDATSPDTGDTETDTKQLLLTARPRGEEKPASTVRVGLTEEPKEGLGRGDVVAPPNRFSAVSLRLEAPESVADRKRLLAAQRRSLRAETSGGMTFDLQLQADSGPVRLSASGLGAVGDREVALLNSSTGQSYDLRAQRAVTLRNVDSTALQLAVGNAAFVENKRQSIVPDEVTLTSYPNPFRTQATVEYTLPEAKDVRITVYDVLGRRVAVLENGRRQAGRHTLRLDGGSLPSGVYFGRLEAGEQTRSQKITVVR